MYVLFVRRMQVDIRCILISILRFDYMFLLFALLVLDGFVLYW
jgi:hypothetical protein